MANEGADGGGGRPNTRPIADMVERIEADRPDLVAARGFSSAALRAGDLIRSMRKAAGLSQTELADRMKVSQARVSELEAGLGSQGPTWDVMERIAKYCGTRLASVVTPATAPLFASRAVEGLVRMGVPGDVVHVVMLEGEVCMAFDVPRPGDVEGENESIVFGMPLAASF